MNPPPNAPVESWLLRLLQGAVRLLLSVLIAALGLLWLAVLWPKAHEAVAQFLGMGDPALARSDLEVKMTLGALLFAGLLNWAGRRLSWRWLGAVAAAVAAVLAYLWSDTASLHRQQTFADVVPTYPNAEASNAVLIRYGKRHPAGRDFQGPTLRWFLFEPEKPELWSKFVTEHRSEIDAEWAALAPVRAWWGELATFEHVSDLMPQRLDGEILAFSPVRALAQRGCAIASLQAIDGRGDAAIETLLPLLEVSRKLQETGRSLVIQMVSIVVERLAMQTASFVLDRATVSAAARARLVAVLSRPGGGEAGARRLVAVERVSVQATILDPGVDEDLEKKPLLLRWTLMNVDPFIFNRRATANLVSDFLVEVENFLGHRQLMELEIRTKQFLAGEAGPGFKNFGGRILAGNAVPAYGKVAVSYWKVQDERAALLAKLGAGSAAK